MVKKIKSLKHYRIVYLVQKVLVIVFGFLLLPLFLILRILRPIIESLHDGSSNKRVSFDKVRAELIRHDVQGISCSRCLLMSYELHWYKFRSSNASWRNLGGVEGFYVKCPACKKKLRDFITVMN
jgi:hypothetical protein